MKLWTRRPDLRNEVERLRNHLAEVEAAHADELANLGVQLVRARKDGTDRASALARQFGPLIEVVPLLLASADVQALARQLHGLTDGGHADGVPYPDSVDDRLVTAGLANQGDSHRGPTLTQAGLVALQAYDQLHQAF